MHNNVVYFEKILSTPCSKAYEYYQKLVDDKIILRPMIFCDKNQYITDNKLPIFHTLYLRSFFKQQVILCDLNNYKLINNYVTDMVLVLYDSIVQNKPESDSSNTIFNDLSNPIPFSSLMSKIYEKV